MCLICAMPTAHAAAPSPLRPAVDAERRAAGLAFLRRHPTLDLHAHPGRFFMAGAPSSAFVDSYAPPDPDSAIADMRHGGLTGVMFATVADLSVLGKTQRGLGATRSFAPGESFADHLRQIDAARSLFDANGIALARSGADIRTAHRSRGLAGFVSVEGGDFIEDRLERIEHAAASGVRSITIVHYRVNQIGDTQTEESVHGGLTPLGRATIAAMEDAGVLVDLSHASFETAKDAAAIATRPMLMSHSNIAPGAGPHPRLISLEHARLVTATGGVIGCVPAGFAQASFDDFVDTILRMIDQLGIDQVAIGTDMDFTYRSVFPSYRDWPALAGTLLARGLAQDEAAKVMGGNVMRILA